MKDEKTRLLKAMEANGVTAADVKTVLRTIFNPKYYDNEMLNGIVLEFIEYDEEILHASTEIVMALALLCNVSTDYLLGMSDNMNYIG